MFPPSNFFLVLFSFSGREKKYTKERENCRVLVCVYQKVRKISSISKTTTTAKFESFFSEWCHYFSSFSSSWSLNSAAVSDSLLLQVRSTERETGMGKKKPHGRNSKQASSNKFFPVPNSVPQILLSQQSFTYFFGRAAHVRCDAMRWRNGKKGSSRNEMKEKNEALKTTSTVVVSAQAAKKRSQRKKKKVTTTFAVVVVDVVARAQRLSVITIIIISPGVCLCARVFSYPEQIQGDKKSLEMKFVNRWENRWFFCF